MTSYNLISDSGVFNTKQLQMKMGPEKGPLSNSKGKRQVRIFALMKRLRSLYALPFNMR